MSERVQCAECERIYDSDEHPFCPRCGGTKHAAAVPAAKSIAQRHDPRRRRVQVAGIIMVSTGALVLLAGIAMVASAGAVWQFASGLDDSEAGALTETASSIDVFVFDEGLPMEGVNVTLGAGEGEIRSVSTDADGYAHFANVSSFVVDLNLQNGEDVWELSFIAMNPTNDPNAPMEVRLEWSDQSVINGPLLDERAVETTTRIMGIGAILLGLTPIIGGIAALRLRNQHLAFMGAVVGGIPWLFMFIASLSLSMLLIMVLFIMAAVFVRQGRDLFA